MSTRLALCTGNALNSVWRHFPFGLLLLLSCLPSMTIRAAMQADTWEALASGNAVAIMRHALAPGSGDPAGFVVDDCETQRNLSPEGKEQARRIGQHMRDNGIRQAELFSSAWCRCVDTATETGLGTVTILEPLNSFFSDRTTSAEQTRALRQWINERLSGEAVLPAVLVTHQVNLTALTGEYPASGEAFVVSTDGDGIVVLGSFAVAP